MPAVCASTASCTVVPGWMLTAPAGAADIGAGLLAVDVGAVVGVLAAEGVRLAVGEGGAEVGFGAAVAVWLCLAAEVIMEILPGVTLTEAEAVREPTTTRARTSPRYSEGSGIC